jgi:uncharacterized damage-inducible protein DinB
MSSPIEAAIFAGWQDYQKQLAKIARKLTPEQLATRPASQLRAAGETLTHLVACRADWFCGVLKEGSEEDAALIKLDRSGEPVRGGPELADGLEQTWKMMSDAWTRWTPEQLVEPIVLPWIGPERPITRAWVVWHVLEHDLHHGGEIAHALGMAGLYVRMPPGPDD